MTIPPLAILLVTLLTAIVAGPRLARRRGGPAAIPALLITSVGAVLALTTTPDTRHAADFAPPPGALGLLGRLIDIGRLTEALTTLPETREQLANIALYVPVGLLGRWYWRGAARAVGFAALLSLGTELWQSYIGRSADLVDVRNNVAGAIIGTLLSAGAPRLLDRLRTGRLLAIAAAGGVAAVLAATVLQPLWTTEETGDDTNAVRVDPSVPDHELLDGVLAAEADKLGFAWLPQTPPSGLRHLLPGSGAEPVTDVYDVDDAGGLAAQIRIEYAVEPSGTCADVGRRCVRRASVPGPALRYVTVYVSTDATAQARRFWATVPLVPAERATWFTALVERARAAPKS